MAVENNFIEKFTPLEKDDLRNEIKESVRLNIKSGILDKNAIKANGNFL